MWLQWRYSPNRDRILMEYTAQIKNIHIFYLLLGCLPESTVICNKRGSQKQNKRFELCRRLLYSFTALRFPLNIFSKTCIPMAQRSNFLSQLFYSTPNNLGGGDGCRRKMVCKQLSPSAATTTTIPTTTTQHSHNHHTRYVKLRVVYATGMPGTFLLPPQVSDPDMHHGTCVMHVPWCMPGSLTSCSFEVGGWENVAGIPGARVTRNFAYLVRSRWHGWGDINWTLQKPRLPNTLSFEPPVSIHRHNHLPQILKRTTTLSVVSGSPSQTVIHDHSSMQICRLQRFIKT